MSAPADLFHPAEPPDPRLELQPARELQGGDPPASTQRFQPSRP